jgi:hypothetical protein
VQFNSSLLCLSDAQSCLLFTRMFFFSAIWRLPLTVSGAS